MQLQTKSDVHHSGSKGQACLCIKKWSVTIMELREENKREFRSKRMGTVVARMNVTDEWWEKMLRDAEKIIMKHSRHFTDGISG